MVFIFDSFTIDNNNNNNNNGDDNGYYYWLGQIISKTKDKRQVGTPTRYPPLFVSYFYHKLLIGWGGLSLIVIWYAGIIC